MPRKSKETKVFLKGKGGITLIALIVTIIVLLILSSISIAMLTGDNGIYDNAKNAKIATDAATTQEKIGLAVMAARIENRNKSVNLETLVDELEKSNVTLVSDGSSFPVKVTDGVNKFSIAESGVIKKVVSVSATEIAANKEQYYGQEVKNYTAGGKIYRIFYVDEAGDFGNANTIYLKADWTANDTYLGSYTSYTPVTTDILALMNSNWWGNRSEASWNANEKVVSYLCDPTTSELISNQAWANYFDGSKANYVIGSPSVEMFVASYNQVSHTVGNYILGASYRATNFPGYIFSLDGAQSTISNSDYNTGSNTIDYIGYNSMYCGKDGAKGNYYTWLASPSSNGVNDLYFVYGNLACLQSSGANFYPIGYSPIVSLKTEVLPEVEI